MARRLAFLIALVAFAWAGAVRAAEPAKGADVEALIAGMGTPPSQEVVEKLTNHHLVRSDVATAQRVVAALAQGGGFFAARGLRSLIGHSQAAVRSAALRGIGDVGLRVAADMGRIRGAVTDDDPTVRLAAIEALGRVGDGADVPLLLDGMASKDEPVRRASHAALVTLTRIRLGPEARRWEAWWRDERDTIASSLERSLKGHLEPASAPADLADARRILDQYAWFDVAGAVEVARRWLRSRDPAVRIAGFALVEHARLGDLAEEAWSTYRYEQNPEAFEAGRRCALFLRYPADTITRRP